MINHCEFPNDHLIVKRLKKLLEGKTDAFSFTGKVLRIEVLGEKNS